MRNHTTVIMVGIILVLAIIVFTIVTSYSGINDGKTCHKEDQCITLSGEFKYHPRYVIR